MKLHTIMRSTIALASLLALAGPAAHADTLDNIKAAKKIRIAVDMAVPPYAMMDDNLQPVGSDVETAKLLAKDLGVQLEIVRVNGANRVPYVLTKKADIVVSQLSITPERQQVIDFSPRYAVIQAVMAAPKSLNIKSYADLAGKRVATTRGTASDKVATENSTGAEIVRYDDDATSMVAMVSGQADIFATTPALIKAINQKNPERQIEAKFVLKNFNLGIGMPKNEPKLREWIDGWVKANLKNGNLNEIYKKYHGAALPADVMN